MAIAPSYPAGGASKEIPLVVLFSFLALPPTPLQFKLPAFRSQVLEQCQARPGRREKVLVTAVASPKMPH